VRIDAANQETDVVLDGIKCLRDIEGGRGLESDDELGCIFKREVV
jgi:hypothetical protein